MTSRRRKQSLHQGVRAIADVGNRSADLHRSGIAHLTTEIDRKACDKHQWTFAAKGFTQWLKKLTPPLFAIHRKYRVVDVTLIVEIGFANIDAMPVLIERAVLRGRGGCIHEKNLAVVDWLHEQAIQRVGFVGTNTYWSRSLQHLSFSCP